MLRVFYKISSKLCNITTGNLHNAQVCVMACIVNTVSELQIILSTI